MDHEDRIAQGSHGDVLVLLLVDRRRVKDCQQAGVDVELAVVLGARAGKEGQTGGKHSKGRARPRGQRCGLASRATPPVGAKDDHRSTYVLAAMAWRCSETSIVVKQRLSWV